MAAAAVSPLRLPKKIRVGLAGMEGHSGEILKPIADVPDLELACVFDPDPKLMAKLPAGVRRYTNYREMLDKEKVDVIGVCGPNHTRTEHILAALARKLHVVAEKPLAIDQAGLDKIRDSLHANKVQLTMLLPMRFSPPYLALKQIVASGQIGEVAQIDAQKSYKLGPRPQWMTRRSTFGGTIPYIGVHMVDLMRWTSGREFVETVSLQGRVGFPEYGEMENTTGSLFRLDNGGIGVLHMDYLRPETAPTHGDDRLRLGGTKGVAEYQAATGVTVVTTNAKPIVVSPLPEGRSLFIDFLDNVYNGKPAGLPWNDIYRVNQIVLASRESAERRRIEKL